MGRPLLPLPFWCPAKSCEGDAVLLSSIRVSNPPHRLRMMMCLHVVLVAVGEKMLIGVGLGPEHALDSSEVLGVEGGQFISV